MAVSRLSRRHALLRQLLRQLRPQLLRRKQGGTGFGQLALRRLLSALDHASGCPTLRPTSAIQPLGRLWPAILAMFSTEPPLVLLIYPNPNPNPNLSTEPPLVLLVASQAVAVGQPLVAVHAFVRVRVAVRVSG